MPLDGNATPGDFAGTFIDLAKQKSVSRPREGTVVRRVPPGDLEFLPLGSFPQRNVVDAMGNPDEAGTRERGLLARYRRSGPDHSYYHE
jgi:hypothetical protein